MAATHCFSKNVMNTLVQDNINPIEKVERSQLIIASSVFNKHPMELIKDEEVARVKEFSFGETVAQIEGASGKNNNNK